MDVKETRKIGYYYTSAGDLNAVRMSFKCEDSGTILYGKVSGDKILLSPDEGNGIPVRVNSTISRYGSTNYLNLRDVLRGTEQFKDKVVDVAEENGTYTISISSNQDFRVRMRTNDASSRRAKRMFKVVTSNTECDTDLNAVKSLKIPTNIWDNFMSGIEDPCIVYEEHYNPAYIVVKCVEAEQVGGMPTLQALRSNTRQIKPGEEKMVYRKTNLVNEVFLSRFFMYNGHIEPDETFHAKIARKNEMIIYRKTAETCEICGRPVHHHIEKMYKLDCCEGCAEAAKTIQAQTQGKTGRKSDKLRQIAKEMREMHDILTKIKEEI